MLCKLKESSLAAIASYALFKTLARWRAASTLKQTMSTARESQGRDYQAALSALGGLIGESKTDRGRSFGEMRSWIKVFEIEEKLPHLSVIHVAGTKGKGSTCAFTDSILRAHGWRVGFFSSPHLVDIRERFRLNGRPMPEEVFLKHFWWCWDKTQIGVQQGLERPGLFKFVTLLALRAFISEGVDVAVMEVGIGGRLDCTNVVPQPVACAVTALGYDHVNILGNTLTEIAREKAGIFKQGSPAFTVPQETEAMASLKQCAAKMGPGFELITVTPWSAFQRADHKPVCLGIRGEHQLQNASLAVQLSRVWNAHCGAAIPSDEDLLNRGLLPELYALGLEKTVWPGRTQVVSDQPGLHFFLDGAHTQESMAACARWFSEVSGELPDLGEGKVVAEGTTRRRPERVLLFNMMDKRDPGTLLGSLHRSFAADGVHIDRAIFVPGRSHTAGMHKINGIQTVQWQEELREYWNSLQNKEQAEEGPQSSEVHPSLESVLQTLRQRAAARPDLQLQVLVTGSLYLVGDMLQELKYQI